MPQYFFSEVEFLQEDFAMMNNFTSQSRTLWFTQHFACTCAILNENDQGKIEPAKIYVISKGSKRALVLSDGDDEGDEDNVIQKATDAPAFARKAAKTILGGTPSGKHQLEAFKGWLGCGELKLAELLEVAPEEEESDDNWGYKGVLPPLFLGCI
ncbi:N-terminal acetyltransferase [Aspergillus niger]|nr:N-terminal acetyltransferase [Aspergillus niger]